MLRTGKDYIESLRDGREVWIDGEQVEDVPTHPAFAPVVKVRARIYDLAHEARTRDLLTYVGEETGESCATTSRPPHSREDWQAKRASVDAILGVAYASARSTGVTMHQGVREKIAQIACYREGINAHLTAAAELAEPSPGGLLMPNQSMMYAGRVFASTQLPSVMHLVRDLCGCQVSLMPSKAMFDSPGAGDWLQKYFRVGEIPAEERRKLFALARDLLNSDYAGHRLTFQLFAQSPPFSHLLAVYNNYDFSGPLDLVARYSNVAEVVRK